MAVRLLVTNGATLTQQQLPDGTLVALLTKAHDWFGRLTSGKVESVGALALQENVSPGYAARMIHLALMAPDIVVCIVRGAQPRDLTAAKLMQLMPLPPEGTEQRKLPGFPWCGIAAQTQIRRAGAFGLCAWALARLELS